MLANQLDERLVRRTVRRKFPVLELDELRQEVTSVPQCLYPITKFGDVLFFYRQQAVPGDKSEVDVNESNRIAVIR